jgi:hypothetical protein
MRGVFNRDRAPMNSEFIGALSLLLLFIFPLTLAYASGGGGEGGPSWVNFAWKLLNFLVMAGIIYWLAAKKDQDLPCRGRNRPRGCRKEVP